MKRTTGSSLIIRAFSVLLFVLILLNTIPNIQAQAAGVTSITDVQYSSQAVLQNGVAQATVTFGVYYNYYYNPQGYLVFGIYDGITSNLVKGSAAASPTPCQSLAGTSYGDSVVCALVPATTSGREFASFTLTFSSAGQYRLSIVSFIWDTRNLQSGSQVSGSSNTWSVTISVTDQTVFTSTAPPFDFSISASPTQQTVAPGASTTFTVYVNWVSGASQNVALAVTDVLPSGISASLNPTFGTPSFNSILSISTTTAASPGQYPITIAGNAGARTQQMTVVLTIRQSPDFRIDVNPPSQASTQGQTASYLVHVSGFNGFNSQVSLTMAGLPAGVGGVFSVPSSLPDFSSTLTVTIPTNAPIGSFTVTITGSGGGITRVANVILVINPSQIQPQTTTEASISGTQTTTTYTAPTMTFGCSGSSCTLDGITVTQYSQPNSSTLQSSSPIPVWVWLLGAVAGIVMIIVAIVLKKKPGQERTGSQNNKPTPSMIVPTSMSKSVAGESLDERVLSYVEGHHGEISISRAAYEIGVTESELKESLSRLSQKGLIRREAGS